MSSLSLKQILLTHDLEKAFLRILKNKEITQVDYTRHLMDAFFNNRKQQDIGWFNYEKLPKKTIYIVLWFEDEHLDKTKELSVRDQISEQEIFYTVFLQAIKRELNKLEKSNVTSVRFV